MSLPAPFRTKEPEDEVGLRINMTRTVDELGTTTGHGLELAMLG